MFKIYMSQTLLNDEYIYFDRNITILATIPFVGPRHISLFHKIY